MLMSVKAIDINIKDVFGMTPFDMITHKPVSNVLDFMFRLLYYDICLAAVKEHHKVGRVSHEEQRQRFQPKSL